MSDPSKNKKEVSDGLKTLAYDPKEILVFKGDTTVSFIPKESRKENDGRYIVIERRQREITESNVDIGMVESIVGRTYPGSLLLANSRLMDNQPDVLSVNRNPIRLRVDLPGMKNDGSIIVEDPGYENVSGSINEVLDIWNEKYAKDHSITARVQYNESMAYSQSQLRAKFGMEITHLANKLNIDFEAVYKKETSVFIAAFKQIFYVVSAELPKDPADVFAPEVTWGELEQKNVNGKNPPAMVAMVGYGRTIFVKMESNSTDTNVEAAFKAVAKDVKASADVKYSEILKNTTFTAYVRGGGAGEPIKIIDA